MIENNLYPLSSPQMDVWLDSVIIGDTSAFNLGGVLEIEGDIDLDVIHEAIEDLAHRCGACRLVLRENGGMPSQEILLTVPGEPDAIQCMDEEAA